MATVQVVDNKSNSAPDLVEVMFSAPSNASYIIESFTAANTSGVNASYSAYIQTEAGELQPQIPFKVVVWGENDLGIGIVNQIIPANGTLKIKSSSADSIYFTVTASEFTI